MPRETPAEARALASTCQRVKYSPSTVMLDWKLKHMPRPAEGGSGAFAVLVLKLESTMVPKIPGVAVSRVDFAWKNLSDILITVCV